MTDIEGGINRQQYEASEVKVSKEQRSTSLVQYIQNLHLSSCSLGARVGTEAGP